MEEFALDDWKQTNSSRRVATMVRVLVLGGVGFLPLLFWLRFSTTPYEPFAHTGWLMRALLSVPAAFVLQIVLAVPKTTPRHWSMGACEYARRADR